jgi:hypothetical protein
MGYRSMGDGDPGETVTTGEGRVLRRLPSRHRRAYQSIFGPFERARVVYGTREGQRGEYVPLESRVRLPAGQCSYRLQDWDQAVAVENPYPQVNGVLQRRLGLEQSVASLEPMTRTLAEAVEGYWAEQVVVLSADGSADTPGPRRLPRLSTRRALRYLRGSRGEWPGWVRSIRLTGTDARRSRCGRRCFGHRGRWPPPSLPQAEARRPAPEPKRVRVNRKGCEPATPVRASEAMFAWLVEQARSRDPAQPRVLRYRSLLRYRSTGGNEGGSC